MKVVFDDDRDGNKSYPTVLAEVVYSNRIDDKWNYSMFIHNFGGEENTSVNTYNEYLQMLYDRDPIFPEEINKDSKALKDLNRNAKQRVVEYVKQKREYPQIFVKKKLKYVLTEKFVKKMFKK